VQTVVPEGVVVHTVVVVMGTVVGGGAGVVVGGAVGTVVCTVVGGAGAVVGVAPPGTVVGVATVVAVPEPFVELDGLDALGEVVWWLERDPDMPARVVVVRPGADEDGDVVPCEDEVEGVGGATVVAVEAACAT
jgi:hypothetical protein